jgi:hypothetical protein
MGTVKREVSGQLPRFSSKQIASEINHIMGIVKREVSGQLPRFSHASNMRWKL